MILSKKEAVSKVNDTTVKEKEMVQRVKDTPFVFFLLASTHITAQTGGLNLVRNLGGSQNDVLILK